MWSWNQICYHNALITEHKKEEEEYSNTEKSQYLTNINHNKLQKSQYLTNINHNKLNTSRCLTTLDNEEG